ncbi:acyltransferase domain-containing protein [Glutamicibacter endophyticus]|uniref:acyltransferase domain-containing protein n=1 Tax=Glutamicibacter endophyticus TaxID=1522174 RepID=UPI003AF12080
MSGGQGSQFVGMGVSQYENDVIFREAVNSLLSGKVLEPIKDAWLNGSAEVLTKSSFAQPLLIALGIASSRSLASRGVHPDALLGHSAGEFALAIFAGLMHDEEARKVLESRAELLKDGPSGSMQAVRSSSKIVATLIQQNELSAWVAADNSPTQCLVSAAPRVLSEFAEIASAKSILSLPAASDMPFHSPLLKEKSLLTEKALDHVRLSELRVPMISGSTGKWISNKQSQNPKFWADQLWKPVKFWDSLNEILQQNWTIVDLGPGTGLSAIAAGHPNVKAGKSEVVSLMPTRGKTHFEDWLNKVEYLQKISL